MKNLALIPALMVLIPLAPCPLTGQTDLLEQPERWTVGAGGAFVVEDGESVLRLQGGASLNEIQFQDGSISFEVRLTSRAGFVGLQFRSGDSDAEHIYFRPHRSDEWDAIQYQPIMNGSSTWQLHRGDGYTAPVTLPHGEWLRVRVEVHGSDAAVYVGDAPEPAIWIALERGVTSGEIALTSGFRGAAREGEVPASFRRFTIEAAQADTNDEWERAAPAEGGFLRQWSVSEPVAVTDMPVTEIPAVGEDWVDVWAEPRGLVNLNRYFSRIAAAERTAVVAHTVIHADSAMALAMAFDFSDDVSVFLNGKLLFTGRNKWESRYPYYLGALHPDILTNEVWLQLNEGENSLSLVVSEQAFGWGFVAKLHNSAGIQVMGQ